MRTNEEIVRKICEMIEDESEKLWDLCSVLNQQDAVKAYETKSKIRRHTAALATLVEIEEFADAYQGGKK